MRHAHRPWADQSVGHADRIASSDALYRPLSPREQQVLPLVAVGATNKDIARELGVATCWAHNLVESLCTKLNVSNRTELAARYYGATPYSWHYVGAGQHGQDTHRPQT